ncbi:hypothetical protein ACJZ2D_014046 [Fusarium nematophilum]
MSLTGYFPTSEIDPLTETGLGNLNLWFGFLNLAHDEEFKKRIKDVSNDLVCMVPSQMIGQELHKSQHLFAQTKPCEELKDYLVANQVRYEAALCECR